MNIKDFIIKGDIPEQEKEVKQKNKTEYVFSVEYENDTDFILKRTTKKTEKLLVVLVSQAQVYIKDVKQNTIEKVTDISQINEFKRGMGDIPKFEKLQWRPFDQNWNGAIRCEGCLDALLNHLETVKILANKKLNPLKNTGLIYDYERDPECFNHKAEGIKIMRAFGSTLSETSYDMRYCIRGLIESKLTYNKIVENKEIIALLGTYQFEQLLKNSQLNSVLNDYLCDFNTLLSWLYYTITNRNGLEIANYYNNSTFNLSDYADYLRMQKEMYGKVKEKYPTYWLSEKQMMNNKYNHWREVKSHQAFSLEQEKAKVWEYEDDVFRVIVPMSSADILDEAQQQQHCVASYIDSIKEGRTHILFIRTRLNEDESLLTVEVKPDGRIVQVRGFQNRAFTDLEHKFMEKWAKEKGLKLEV